MSDLRPRRSVLYMPAANERALEKAKGLDADALIFDLEDAVAPDAKVDARARACAAVTNGGYGAKELTIRANGRGTEWHEADLAAIAAAGPDAVVVPKVNTPDEVLEIAATLERHGAPARTRIWAMIETPTAIRNALAIATATERLNVLVMGTNDLVKELRAQRVVGRAPLLTALSLAVLAAREGDVTILDGVYNDLNDEEGFALECRQGRAFGFDGKTLIHPNQVARCNEEFSPTADDVDLARRTIAAFDEATAAGRGVVTLDGRMIENLHVDEARRVLAVQDAIERNG